MALSGLTLTKGFGDYGSAVQSARLSLYNVTVTGNDGGTTFRLALELHQDQKVGKQVVDVHSATDIPVACGTTPKAWSATMGLAAGESFNSGAARATAATFQTPEWVTPATAAGAVKISGRK